MNNELNLAVILQLLGVVVIIAEIILPSGGILSILATALFGYSLYVVFANISPAVGLTFIMADLVLIPVLIYFGLKFLAKSPVTLRKRLSKEEGVTSQSPEHNDYMGCRGKAITDLRPSGVVVIDGIRVDVVTRGEYIEKQTEVVVIAVGGNRIVVKEKREN